MEIHYTVERNVQILIALLKAHGIKKIIISPGSTNMCFVQSVQHDSFFELYSCNDERSAAYMACGLAAESGEPVALSCTGATASRNYIPGLTEAFYRKLPVLAITSSQYFGKVGQNFAQVMDRSVQPNDIVNTSVHISTIYNQEDQWASAVKINKAILELTHRGGGPAHINIETQHSRSFTCKQLPDVKVIKRIIYKDKFPELEGKKIAIFIGAHQRFTNDLTNAIDEFCEKYNSVVLCDHTSNYTGKYGIYHNVVCNQEKYFSDNRNVDILIDLGNISGTDLGVIPSEVWRVNIDGEIRDRFRKLTKVFEMEEVDFFNKYNIAKIEKQETVYYNRFRKEYNELIEMIPEVPFSNAWIAQKSSELLPPNSVLHMSIYNSLRCMNYFETDKSILGYANTGGFGTDGGLSSLIGASLSNMEKLFFGVVGDLAFFYDINSLGNRHIGNNVRLILINNGLGTEFRNYFHTCSIFGEDTDAFISAAGHFGNQSKELVKSYAEALGFQYMCAENKEEFMKNTETFFDSKIGDKSIIFEIFTDSKDESDALLTINNLKTDPTYVRKKKMKTSIKKVVEKGKDIVPVLKDTAHKMGL